MTESSAPDEHVVFFTTALGDPAAERYPSLQSAVSRVESLCNEDHVQDAKVYALVPVPLQTRTYLHVAVDGASLLGALSVPGSLTAPAAPATPPPSAGRDTATPSDQDPGSAHESELGDYTPPTVDPDQRETTEAETAPDYQAAGFESVAEGVATDAGQDSLQEADGSPSQGRNLGFFVH